MRKRPARDASLYNARPLLRDLHHAHTADVQRRIRFYTKTFKLCQVYVHVHINIDTIHYNSIYDINIFCVDLLL